jgi:hypothetical protein
MGVLDKVGNFMENASDKITEGAAQVIGSMTGQEELVDKLQNVGDAVMNYDGMFDGDGNPFKDNANKRPKPGSAPGFTAQGTRPNPAFEPGGARTKPMTGSTTVGGGGCCGCKCGAKTSKPKYSCEEKCAYGKMMKDKCATVRACQLPSYYRKKRTYKKKNTCRKTNNYKARPFKGRPMQNGKCIRFSQKTGKAYWGKCIDGPSRPSAAKFAAMGQRY